MLVVLFVSLYSVNAGQGTFNPNALVLESAYAGLRGEIALPLQSGLCLAMVRIIIENAFDLESNEWYHIWRTYVVPRGPDENHDPWARDMEASLRNAGMEVALPRAGGPKGDETRYVVLLEDLLKPGDLLFRWDSPQRPGHVGILMPGNTVLENVRRDYRPVGLWRGAIALTPLGSWPVTTVIRFDPRIPPAPR